MTELTFKQKQFCEFYVGNGNATLAAKLAGYSEKSAYATGHENLKNMRLSSTSNHSLKLSQAHALPPL